MFFSKIDRGKCAIIDIFESLYHNFKNVTASFTD